MQRNVVVISGPTGSGESTITRELISRYPMRMCRLVTATTRPPRLGEENEKDYYFFSKEEFEQKDREGLILEKAYIPNRDTWYGSYAPDLLGKIEQGFIVIVNSQIVGTKYFKANHDAVTIFIDPETVESLIARIRSRSPELLEEEIQSRKENAEREVLEEGPFYDYHVVNKDGKLTEALECVVEILKKEGYNLQND